MHISPVATIFAFVPNIFGIITSYRFTGALTVTVLITAIHGISSSRGIGLSERTGISGVSPPCTLIDVVSILAGWANSLTAYSSPRLHWFPSTLDIDSPSPQTLISQPIGQVIHVIVFSVIRYSFGRIALASVSRRILHQICP